MKNKKKFYITTPIFYPNNKLHLGHGYTVTISDVIARYKRLQGYEVYFQTGSDEHGEKIAKTAELNNVTPQQLVDKNIALFKELWSKLDISDHYFTRTTFKFHENCVREIFNELLSRDDVYLGEYRGDYCVVCEEYINDPKFNESLKKMCPSCQSELREISETAYFLRVEKHRRLLINHYKNNNNFLSPEKAVNEIFQSFLNSTMPDLCITRSDLKWGIPVPGKQGMTFYVWFDALLNYLTSEKGKKLFFKDSDCEIVQVIGKDILRFHGIYWIILLMMLDRKIPNKIISHGWILNSGSKMSKSKGNVINPLDILEKYHSDVLRSYFVARVSLYQDGTLDEGLLADFYQSFFINNLGNYFSRICRMVEIYNESIIPDSEITNKIIIDYNYRCSLLTSNYFENMDNYQLSDAFRDIENILDESNRLISNISPWKIFANGDRVLLNEAMLSFFNSLKVVSYLLLPIAPFASKKIIYHLGIDLESINSKNCLDFNSIKNKKIKKLNEHLFN